MAASSPNRRQSRRTVSYTHLGAVAAAPQLRTDAEMLHIAEVLRLPVEQQPHEFRPIKKLGEMVLRVGQDGPLLIGQPLLVAGKAGLVEGHRPSKRRFLRLCQPSPFHSSLSSLLKNALPFWERILFFLDVYKRQEELYRRTRTEGFGPEVKKRILLGTFVLSADCYDSYYKKALQARARLKAAFDAVFQRYDLLLTPVAPTTAPRLGEGLADPLSLYLSCLLYTSRCV